LSISKDKTFKEQIEDIIRDNNLTYLEAVMYYCEKKDGIEVETVARLCRQIKEELWEDAIVLNLVKEKDDENSS